MCHETDEARQAIAFQLIQLIDAVARIRNPYDQTKPALDVVDAITNYIKLQHAKP